MESLGEKIRKYREEKGYSLEQVARDTHITKRFLEAMEDENFASLPGESYVIGFLRTYSEYLGLNPDEMVSHFRNMRLQEQQVPMEELLVKPGLPLGLKAVIGVLGFALLVFGGWVIYNSGATEANVAVVEAPILVESGIVVFDGRVLENTFTEGTIIKFPLGALSVDVILAYKGDKILLGINNDEITLEAGKISIIDLNQDGVPDVRFLVRSVDSRSSPAKMVTRIDRDVDAAAASESDPVPVDPTTPVATPGPVASLPSLPGLSSIPSRQKAPVILLESPVLGPVSLKLQFSAPTMFRTQSEGGAREERMSGSSEIVNLQGNSWVRFWVSNGAAAKVVAGGKDFPLGLPGEVSAWQAVWVASATGSQILQLQPLY